MDAFLQRPTRQSGLIAQVGEGNMQIARVRTVLLIVVEGVSLTSTADAAATTIASKVEDDSLLH